MGVRKQSVSFTDAAFDFAPELVESGEYANISAAVSGKMARARAARERERLLFEAEVQRRLALPLDAWEPVPTGESITSGARAHLARRATGAGGSRGKAGPRGEGHIDVMAGSRRPARLRGPSPCRSPFRPSGRSGVAPEPAVSSRPGRRLQSRFRLGS